MVMITDIDYVIEKRHVRKRDSILQLIREGEVFLSGPYHLLLRVQQYSLAMDNRYVVLRKKSVKFVRKIFLGSASAALFLFLIAPAAVAASFPWRSATLSYQAKSSPISRVLDDIFVTQYRPVVISNAVKSMPTLNGNFSHSPQAFFDYLSKAYGLIGYFDGTTMFVTTLAENQAVLQTLTRVSAQEVERVAKEFGYLDSRFLFRKVNQPSALQLSGPPAFIERINNVVSMLEAGAVDRAQDARLAFRVLPLKHAWAEDVVYNVAGREVVIRGVASSLRDLVEGFGAAPTQKQPVLAPPTKPVTPVRRPVSLFEGLLSSDIEHEFAAPKQPLAADLPLTERGQAVGARIVGDTRMNAVVVMAPLEMLGMLEDVVRELDVEPELIQIEATIMDVQGDVLKEIGFDWKLAGSRYRIGSSTSGRGIGDSRDGLDAYGAARGNGSNFSIFGGSEATNFLARITALQTTGKANILSRPKLATLNGIEAVLSNQKVFYPQVRGERVSQLYQIDVGLLMRVIPMVVKRENGRSDIRLRIFIEDGNIGNIDVDKIPLTNRSNISTQAIVQDGQSLLIGGYVTDIDDNSEAKVPLLGDIPGLGALFRYRKNKLERQERLFLITPRLLRGAEIEAQVAAATAMNPMLAPTASVDMPIAVNSIAKQTARGIENSSQLAVITAVPPISADVASPAAQGIQHLCQFLKSCGNVERKGQR
ncbi:type III secretion system outer membrane ring subunit SctC [Collimonas sp. H4R21]|uniref:Type III secretion system outer membrane ring subunit SctC n=1 Tax=Collimonas rhizosphaerae TaxID=3126357 RepID=A0ABU9PYL0_9BURK